jgi:hypothetical protein
MVPAMLPLLAQGAGPTTTQRKSPLEIYGFSDTTDQAIDELRKTGGPPSAQVVNSTAVFSFTPVAEEQARLGEPAGSFATMCNDEYAANHGKAIATASLPQPSPPASSNAPYIRVAKVCLAMRIVARSLFNAGVNPTQPLVIKALHKLPYIENELFAGPKPRPNQVVNEPVARVEQVVVLSQAEYPCTHPAPPKNPADAQVCWAPVSGWDNGGKSANAPLLAPNFATAGIPKELLTK